MSTFIAGFICALLLAAVIVLFIAYCMFCKERHKSERFQYDITDTRLSNYEVAQEKNKGNKEVAGVFVLARKSHKQDYSYSKRPDYPEGPVGVQPGMETSRLIEIVSDSSPDTDKRKCVDFNLDPDVPYHSEV
ncbi:unnamed protein product [Leptidea sinapis]|uniref:Uncharacterized protein n=1 Tax=Leptidea sinapis TaxID=189913 RepID=A0A5E4QWT5_9NEOP|nr:unnamed protein product [Leptidea sinapis]